MSKQRMWVRWSRLVVAVAALAAASGVLVLPLPIGRAGTARAAVPTDAAVKLDASISASYGGSGATWSSVGSESGVSASIVGSPAHTTGSGGYFTLTGGSQYFTIADRDSIDLSMSASRTFQMWLRPSTNEAMNLIIKDMGPSTWDGLQFQKTATGALQSNTNGSSFSTPLASPGSQVCSGNWYLVSFVTQLTSTASSTKIYVNGSQVASGAHGAESGYSNTASMYLANWFKGDIAMFAAYTYELTSTQIGEIYDAERIARGFAAPSACDMTAPSAPGTPVLAAASDSGSSSSDNTTKVTAPTISVTAAENGGTVTVTATKAGSSNATCTMTGNTSGGTCTLSGLVAGTWSITASQADAAGNTSSASSALSVVIDTTSPTASVTAATIQASGSATVQSTEIGTAYLVSTSIAVSTLTDITGADGSLWNSQAIAAAVTNTSMSAAGLQAGNYKVFAVDVAGNLSAASSNTVTVDVSCALGGSCVVGDTGPGGGLVFYVHSDADNKFTAPGTECGATCRYLEAAPTGWANGTSGSCTYSGTATTDPACVWSGDTTTAIGAAARGTAVGSGFGNTQEIVAQSSTNFRAAVMAWDYSNNGKSDWYLPAESELSSLYVQRVTVGNLSNEGYWSSTEVNATQSRAYLFQFPLAATAQKDNHGRVRPIRAFGLASDVFAVSYDSQGGSAISSGMTSTGGTIAASPGTPTRNGYTFAGWFAASSGGSALTFAYAHGQTAAFTLYAQWTANSFAVSYDSQGGSAIPGGLTSTGGTIAVSPGTPTRSGYTFAGWFVASSGGSAITFAYSHGQTAAFTLYAQWVVVPTTTTTVTTFAPQTTAVPGVATTTVPPASSTPANTVAVTDTTTPKPITASWSVFAGKTTYAAKANLALAWTLSVTPGVLSFGSDAIVLTGSAASDCKVNSIAKNSGSSVRSASYSLFVTCNGTGDIAPKLRADALTSIVGQVTGPAIAVVGQVVTIGDRTAATTTIAPATTSAPTTTTSSTTVSPSSTRVSMPASTTTVPPIPIQPEVLARVGLSQPVAILGGQPTAVEVVERPESLEVTVGGVVATIGGMSGARNPLALNSSSEVEVMTDESVQFTLKGFLQDSRVDLWVYAREQERQKFLGTFSTDNAGVLTENIQMRAAELTGALDLVISGTNVEGEKVSIGIPMRVVQGADSNGFVASLLAALLFAIGGFFMFIVMRRHEVQRESFIKTH